MRVVIALAHVVALVTLTRAACLWETPGDCKNVHRFALTIFKEMAIECSDRVHYHFFAKCCAVRAGGPVCTDGGDKTELCRAYDDALGKSYHNFRRLHSASKDDELVLTMLRGADVAAEGRGRMLKQNRFIPTAPGGKIWFTFMWEKLGQLSLDSGAKMLNLMEKLRVHISTDPRVGPSLSWLDMIQDAGKALVVLPESRNYSDEVKNAVTNFLTFVRIYMDVILDDPTDQAGITARFAELTICEAQFNGGLADSCPNI